MFSRTSLVVQWVTIHLPMQVCEYSTGRGATEPMDYNYRAHDLQLLKPLGLEPVLSYKKSYRDEKPRRCNKE